MRSYVREMTRRVVDLVAVSVDILENVYEMVEEGDKKEAVQSELSEALRHLRDVFDDIGSVEKDFDDYFNRIASVLERLFGTDSDQFRMIEEKLEQLDSIYGPSSSAVPLIDRILSR